MLRTLVLLLLFSGYTKFSLAQESLADTEKSSEDALPTVEETVLGLEKSDGFLPFYWNPNNGTILIELPKNKPFERFLYVHSLATGLGSNPVGLDRGQLGSQKVVRFERIGPKVLLLQENLRFRANSDNALEQRSVEQSFAQSVIWGGKVLAESDDRFLVDLTSLLMSDVHGVIQTLAATEQGDFTVDQDRSAVYLAGCKAFPDNTELESTLTFSGTKPGRYVQQTTPTPNSITLREHHSFVRLPDNGYRTREYNVRCPSISITFADYATPLDASLQKRWIIRHRLQKKDPAARLSEPIEPIVYYVDPGAPRQIQMALIEGASWWNQAFESAGFKNAFQVKLLPADADPLDVRYNVIQWVHRSTRGWSYGGSVVDPRTGEIIKGHVTLGSLRVRQDRLLFSGLQSPSNPEACGVAGVAQEAILARQSASDPLEIALARIRQLSAHEVGHTLGFVHNFAASTYDDRASVMDYPAPRVKINDGQLDLSDAYAVGIGSWDKISVRYAYTEFSEEADETKELQNILNEARERGMIFISDADARPAHAAQPFGNLWDNGDDPIEELNHAMDVRKIALEGFDLSQLPKETTTADVAQYLTPIYLHHRYQLNAAGKMIGGYDYRYATVGETNISKQPIDWATQSKAVEALMETIRPSALTIPPRISNAISPRPYEEIRDAEIVSGKAGRIFDPIAAAEIACELTLNELFEPRRLARLAIQSQESNNQQWQPRRWIPQTTKEIIESSFVSPNLTEQHIAAVICESLLEKLISIADDSSVNLDVRIGCLEGIRIFSREMQIKSLGNYLIRRAQQALNRSLDAQESKEYLDPPPGSPIGSK